MSWKSLVILSSEQSLGLGFEPKTGLDDFTGHLFCFRAFGVRRSIVVLDPENQPKSVKIRTGSGTLGLKLIELKKKLRYRYRPLDPSWAENLVLNFTWIQTHLKNKRS